MGLKIRFRSLWLFQVAADLTAIAAAYTLTFQLRFRSDWGLSVFSIINRRLGIRDTAALGEPLELFYLISAPRIILLVLGTLVVLYALMDLYPGRRFMRRRPWVWSLLVANVLAIVLFYTYFYLQRNVFHPRSFFALLMLLNVILGVGFRALNESLLAWCRSRWGWDRQTALLVGGGAEAEYLYWMAEEFSPHGIRVGERLASGTAGEGAELAHHVEDAARKLEANLLIVADRSLSVAGIMRLLEVGDRLRVPVKVLSDKLDVLVDQARIPVDRIRGIPLVHFEAPREAAKQGWISRGVSFVAGAVLLLVASPVLLVVAALVRLTTAGPVFFVQERIGVNRRPFFMYKFRTMYDQSEEARAQVEEFNEGTGPLFKIRKDPRVTPVGHFLRRFSLDELPQLFNVLRGEMVLVGPRPLPRRDFEHYYEEWHYSRHSGMPGLTCLWQVSGRSDIDFHNMCILDVYYLRNQSWVQDLKILLRTAWVVAFARGAY